jgi:DNA-binding response OmpR family regulator
MHILIVEDEAGIVQFLKQGLEEEGYKVSTASDGHSGFEMVQNTVFDIILLDWMLPKMSGINYAKP